MFAHNSKFQKQHTVTCSQHGYAYYQKKCVQYFHFLHASKFLNGCQEDLKNIFQIQESSLTATKLNVNSHLDFLTHQSPTPTTKVEIPGKWLLDVRHLA